MADPSTAAEPDIDLHAALDRMADGFFVVDADWRITYTNEAGEEILREAMSETPAASAGVVGVRLWDAVPGAVDTEFYDRYHEAMNTQEPVAFEARYPPLERWFDVRVFPSETGLSVHLRDITDQRAIERQQRRGLNAIQRLYAVSSDADRSFEAKLESVLELTCEYLEVPNGFLTRIDDGTQYIEASHATHPELQADESCPLDEAYCRQTVDADELLTAVDAVNDGWEDDPAHERFGLGTYVGGRVTVDGELYGTLCFADTVAREKPFSGLQRTFVELLTRWVSYELERRRDRSRLQSERDRLDEFASVVSHDLRNPLNTAMGHLDLLAAESDSERIPPIERSLSRMEALIDDLLTLARDGLRAEEFTDVDLAETAQDAWSTAETAGAELSVELDQHEVRADESRLRQLLENLFRNAVDHTGADATVRLESLPGAAGFAVEDDGPGIPETQRDAVFETGFTTSEDGTGFGLSIVAEIASAHGWTVALTDGRDGGARFEFDGVGFPAE